MSIKKITCWKCSDGTKFETKGSAEYHEEKITKTALANEALEQGKSLAECFKILGGNDCDEILNHVSKSSKLSIGHWQCRDEAGYSPTHINLQGQVMVYGHAGSWSGPYGNWCSFSEVARYAKNKNSIL